MTMQAEAVQIDFNNEWEILVCPVLFNFSFV